MSRAMGIAPRPSQWVLPLDSPVVRQSRRPKRFRQANFDELYDQHTVFYDAVRTMDGRHAILLGPPLLEFHIPLRLEITTVEGGISCNYSVRNLDRHAQVWVDLPVGMNITALRIMSAIGSSTMSLQDNSSHRFAGRRVVYSINKNNRLQWICDWIRFHRDIHGADAVLLYDNGSTDYTLDELSDAIARISGIAVALIVPWTFKWGPPGLGNCHWNSRHWDSNYCQLGVLEDARWRFLQEAHSVLNVDVDELVLSEHGSIFELAESSSKGYVLFDGSWVVGADEKARGPHREHSAAIRHRDFTKALLPRRAWVIDRRFNLPTFTPINSCPPKWALVPRQCPNRSQWKAHKATGYYLFERTSRIAVFRHFRHINTSWKYDRTGLDGWGTWREAELYDDVVLRAAFERVKWSD